jgi:hypothetical protein
MNLNKVRSLEKDDLFSVTSVDCICDDVVRISIDIEGNDVTLYYDLRRYSDDNEVCKEITNDVKEVIKKGNKNQDFLCIKEDHSNLIGDFFLKEIK